MLLCTEAAFEQPRDAAVRYNKIEAGENICEVIGGGKRIAAGIVTEQAKPSDSRCNKEAVSVHCLIPVSIFMKWMCFA